ncbi:MAG: DsbA family protein [Candidatus Komeilibacteria bacterium]
MEEKKKKIPRSKISFGLGILSGVGIMFMIGFFVLLAMFLSGNNSLGTGNKVAGNNIPSVNSGQAPTKDITVSPVSKEDWMRGDKKAPISIIEFSDTECPFCKRFHTTMQQIVEEYDGEVNWIYRHFPLTSLHSKAAREAEATECAGELAGNDGFWKYIDRLFAVTPSNNGLSDSELYNIADYVGLNSSDFRTCLESGKYASKVRDHANQAQAAGGSGTPYSIIIAGDKQAPLSGALPIEQLRTIIDSLLQ